MILTDHVKELASSIKEDAIAWRRHFHAQPELSFQEFNTANFVKRKLDEMGIEWQPMATTGIVAMIKGQKPETKVVALRADMDALPIQELNKVDYASKNPGVMHACGHDFHTASLLGTAKILTALKTRFTGSVKLLFQPGEEVLPGGASIMIREGALTDPVPEVILGQHAMPSIPVGMIGIRKGKHMASMDALRVRVMGKGGHGAEPHAVIDPVVIASHIIIALQQIVSRNKSPKEPSVLSFGKVIANGAVNVIPDEVYMEGTFRAMNEQWRDKAHGLMATMAENIASGMGGKCVFSIERGFPFLVNEEKLTEDIRSYAEDYLGKEKVLDQEIWMAAEDFAYYSQVADTCFYLCGVGNRDKGITSLLHTPTFDIDENAFEISTGLMAYFALRKLEDNR